MNPIISRLIAGVSLAGIVIALHAGPALAHTELDSSVPNAGAVLDIAPVDVVLTFSEDLLAASVEASILDASGTLLYEAVPLVIGAVMTIPWPDGLPAGEYEVPYRVASGDGHPITGSVKFSFERAAVASSGPSSSTPSEGSSATTPGLNATSPEAVSSEQAPAVAAPGGGLAINPMLVVLLLLIVATVGGVVAVRRGRR